MTDWVSDLMKLKELKESGALTEKEFEGCKKKLWMNSGIQVGSESERIPERETQAKKWHSGNGPLKGGAKQQLGNYHSGLKGGYAWICHGTEQDEWTQRPGPNAHKQFKEFNSFAKEGDKLFLHCSHPSISGLTHYGYFTGEIQGTNDPGISHICVYEWFPLPKVVKGSGKRGTLYEVTPKDKKGNDTKNFQNYSIPS